MNTYLNGNLLGTYIPGSQSFDNTTAYRIGRRWDDPDYVTGQIGEVRIYGTPLNAAQVQHLYTTTAPTYST
jgi:hypothetical protein